VLGILYRAQVIIFASLKIETMDLKTIVKAGRIEGILNLFKVELDEKLIQLQPTRKEFEGDITLNVFPFVKQVGMAPEALASKLGEFLVAKDPFITNFNVVKGFLNLCISREFWVNSLKSMAQNNELVEKKKAQQPAAKPKA